MKNKIAQRLTLYFAIVLLVFALLSGVFFSLMFARHTADVTAEDMQDHAVSIANTLSHFIGSYNQGECSGSGFKSYVRFIGEAATGDLFLLDKNCNPASLGEMKLPDIAIPQEAPPLVRRVFEENAVICESFSTSLFHADNLIAGAPVHGLDGNVIYALLLRAPLGSIDHTLGDTFYILAACLSIAGILGIVVSVILSHRFVTPLHKMKECTSRLTTGDYSVKTGVSQSDEIGILAEHIDALAQQLSSVEKERQELDQMRQNFFSDISHELRTPLAVLKGSIELLSEGYITDEALLRTRYDQLYADAAQLERLVNDLLELTRLQNPHFQMNTDVINLSDVLSDSVRLMRQHAEKKKILIHFDNQAGPFPVMGDYGRLRQLMIILLDNAIKFSSEHSAIELIAKQKAGGCEVSVTDHGTGMDEETMSHIFARYFHNNTNQNRSGTGLGLPIAKEIALRHQAEFSCESRPGEGTRFTLFFSEQELMPDN